MKRAIQVKDRKRDQNISSHQINGPRYVLEISIQKRNHVVDLFDELDYCQLPLFITEIEWKMEWLLGRSQPMVCLHHQPTLYQNGKFVFFTWVNMKDLKIFGFRTF